MLISLAATPRGRIIWIASAGCKKQWRPRHGLATNKSGDGRAFPAPPAAGKMRGPKADEPLDRNSAAVAKLDADGALLQLAKCYAARLGASGDFVGCRVDQEALHRG